jgi:sRNA-binding carbon storage regulator CsrA
MKTSEVLKIGNALIRVREHSAGYAHVEIEAPKEISVKRFKSLEDLTEFYQQRSKDHNQGEEQC